MSKGGMVEIRRQFEMHFLDSDFPEVFPGGLVINKHNWFREMDDVDWRIHSVKS